jgi:hypothetical protein
MVNSNYINLLEATYFHILIMFTHSESVTTTEYDLLGIRFCNGRVLVCMPECSNEAFSYQENIVICNIFVKFDNDRVS